MNRMSQVIQVWCIGALMCGLVSHRLYAIDGPGMAAERPARGRYVETPLGFMVPYEQTIPGTEIRFFMEPIAGGEFLMGSPEQEGDRQADEGPQRKVHIAPFWIGRYEVTWSEYKYFMSLYEVFKSMEGRRIRRVTDDNRIDAVTVPTPLYTPSFTYGSDEPPEPQQPAVTMSHYAARQYTKWLSGITGSFFRLPSEAEWEYACRAGTTTAYHFGDDPQLLGDFAWYYENADETYHNVGQKKPNPWGLFDMHGNVSELVMDQYVAEAYATPAGEKRDIEHLIMWANKPYPHVMRGGGWDSDPPHLRSAARGKTEDWRSNDPNLPKSPWWFTDEPARCVGFRLLRPLEAPPTEQRQRYWQLDSEMLQISVESRIEGGRGVYGLVDPELPQAILQLNGK